MEFRPWKDQEPGLGRSVCRARGGHHRICRHVTGARVSAPRHSLLNAGQLLRQVVGFGERWFDDLQSTGPSLRSARVHVTGWLKSTLEKIAGGHPQSRVRELLPWNFDPASN